MQFGSDNTDVATVNQKGFVTAVSVGTANITATFTAEDGSVVNKTCVVTVGYYHGKCQHEGDLLEDTLHFLFLLKDFLMK